MKSGRLVVRHHSPVQRMIMWAVGLSLLLGSGYGLYSWGNYHAGFDRSAALDREDGFKGAIRELERQNLELRDRIALLDRSTQMDQQAYQDVNNNLRALQEEVLELREEVAFYRGIVSPREASSGLRIERMELEKTPNEDSLYHYQLVLTQVLKNQRNVHGSVSFSILGTQNGQPRTLNLRSVSVQKQSSQNFKFRYFQKLDGDVLLPNGFVPRSVEVTVRPSRKKNINQAFSWEAVVKGGASQTIESEKQALEVVKEE